MKLLPMFSWRCLGCRSPWCMTQRRRSLDKRCPFCWSLNTRREGKF